MPLGALPARALPPRLSRSTPVLALALLLTLALAPGASRASGPMHVFHPEPMVPSVDGPVEPLAPAAGILPHRRLGPIGGTGFLALANIQSEMTVAASGSQVVLGENDFRGTTSSSGVMYSSDGGVTFTDGGQLPLGTGQGILGDPVLTVYTPTGGGAPTFYYASIFKDSTGLQTLCVHRSTNGGASWSGPFKVTAATATGHTADKEWAAVDPETGRLFISWTDFPTTGSSSIKVTYSDDQGVTWAAAKTVGINQSSGQGSSIACDPHNQNVYVVWYGFSNSSPATYICRSTTNGTTFGAAAVISTYSEVVPPYGFDRSNSYPSVAVNPSDFGVEVVRPASVNGTPTADFGDVQYMRSTDGGLTFGAPKFLNALPGSDRSQVFPTVAAASNGRIDVFWYDESTGSGVDDWTDLFYTYSSDFGATWSSPVPVNSTPWHNESGNNFSAPHQGDYIDATTNTATLSAYGGASQFADPNPLSTMADPLVATISSIAPVAALRVRSGSVTFSDYGCNANDGFLVAGESAHLTIPLQNFGRTSLSGISATLTSLTSGVTIANGAQTYPNLMPGASASSSSTYDITLAQNYPCGQDIKFHLAIAAAGMTGTYVEFTVRTGVVATTTTLLSQNFDGVVAPALPSGWTLNNGCTTCTANNWVTTTTSPMSPPNAAYAPDATYSSFGRLFGPVVSIPAGITYVEVQFDISYNLEAQDTRYAWDAASFEYQLDGAGGSHFATADAIDFDNRYTHYVDRSSGSGNGDRSGWSNNSGGYKHVRVRIPGLAGHTLTPRFSLTTDGNTGVSGVWVDNVVVTALTMGCGTCTPTGIADHAAPADGLMLRLAGQNPFRGGTTIAYTLAERVPVRVDVYTTTGRLVRTLVDQQQNAGAYAVPFGLREGGAPLPAGVYVVRVSAGRETRALRVTALD